MRRKVGRYDSFVEEAKGCCLCLCWLAVCFLPRVPDCLAGWWHPGWMLAGLAGAALVGGLGWRPFPRAGEPDALMKTGCRFRMQVVRHMGMPLSLLSCLVAVTVGCREPMGEERVREKVLEANPGLNWVLENYKDDSLKYRAALFLIDNLPYYQGPDTGVMRPVYYACRLFSTGEYTYRQALDAAARRYGGPLEMENVKWKSDVDIQPSVLVANIEWAFKVWRGQPWGKNVPFGQFCEYVLPHRVGNEELMPWRERLYYQFMPILKPYLQDPRMENPAFAARVLLDSLQRVPFCFTGEVAQGIRIGPQVVDWRGGSCLDLCDMLVYVYRALGIPCGIEELPVGGDGNAPDFWNFTVDADGQTWYFSLAHRWHGLLKAEAYGGVYGKVFRHRFSLNRAMMDSLQAHPNSVHPVFRYPFFEDVTRLYATDRAFTLHIGRERFVRKMKDREIVYLCMSDRHLWKPVGWTRYDGAATFADCHGGTVYCLATYGEQDDSLRTVTSPFSVDAESGELTFHEPDGGTGEVASPGESGQPEDFFLFLGPSAVRGMSCRGIPGAVRFKLSF